MWTEYIRWWYCSVTKSRPTLCDPMDCRMPGFPVPHYFRLPKFMSSESVMPSNHLVLCCPLLLLPSIFPASGSFPVSQLFTSGGQSIRALASASILSVNIQGWFPLGLTGFISLLSKGLSRVFSSTTIQKHLITCFKLIVSCANNFLPHHWLHTLESHNLYCLINCVRSKSTQVSCIFLIKNFFLSFIYCN